MTDISKSDLMQMGRRRFIKNLTALGVTGPAIAGASKNALADVDYDPENEVLRVQKWVHTNHEEVVNGAFPERKPVYYTISREKWARVEAANNAANKIRRQLASQFDRSSFTVGVHKTIDNGHRRRGINVDYITVEHPDGTISEPDVSFEQFRVAVPDYVTGTAGLGTKHETTITDIPVSVSDSTETLEAYYTSRYDNVPGGCYYEVDPVAGWISYGTTATPAKNSNNNPVLVTCGHNFDQTGDGTTEATELHQDAYDGQYYYNFVGDVNQFNNDPDFDMAIVGVDASDRGVVWDLANNSGGYKGYDITGVVSKQYLSDNIGMELEKQGSETGTVTGTVEEVGSTWMKLQASKSGDGDSGGPYYDAGCDFDSCTAQIAAVHRGTTDSDNNMRKGTLMESIENSTNITV